MLMNKERRGSEISQVRRSSLISLTFGNDLGPFATEGDFSFPGNLLTNGLGRGGSGVGTGPVVFHADLPGASSSGGDTMLDLLGDEDPAMQAVAVITHAAGYHDSSHDNNNNIASGNFNYFNSWNADLHNNSSGSLMSAPYKFTGAPHGSTFSVTCDQSNIGGGFDEAGSNGFLDEHAVMNNSKVPNFINIAHLQMGAASQYSNQALLNASRLMSFGSGLDIGMMNRSKDNISVAPAKGGSRGRKRKKTAAASKTTTKQQKRAVAATDSKSGVVARFGRKCMTSNAQKLALNHGVQSVKGKGEKTIKKGHNGPRVSAVTANKKQAAVAAAATAQRNFVTFNPLIASEPSLTVSSLIGQAKAAMCLSAGAPHPLSGSSIITGATTVTKAKASISGFKKKSLGAPKRSREQSSQFRGVSKCSKDSRWQARIRVGKEVKYLGRFKNEEDAARCYDKAAACLHGKRAHFNYPEESAVFGTTANVAPQQQAVVAPPPQAT